VWGRADSFLIASTGAKSLGKEIDVGLDLCRLCINIEAFGQIQKWNGLNNPSLTASLP